MDGWLVISIVAWVMVVISALALLRVSRRTPVTATGPDARARAWLGATMLVSAIVGAATAVQQILDTPFTLLGAAVMIASMAVVVGVLWWIRSWWRRRQARDDVVG
jgi:hypothetical protein